MAFSLDNDICNSLFQNGRVLSWFLCWQVSPLLVASCLFAWT